MLVHCMAIAWLGLSLPGVRLVDGHTGDEEGPEMALGKGLNLLPSAVSEGPHRRALQEGHPKPLPGMRLCSRLWGVSKERN